MPRPTASLAKVMTAYLTLKRYPLTTTGNGFTVTVTAAEARAEALPTDHLASDNLYDVIYRVDNASDAQLARLEQCLQKYPSVLGVDIQTSGDS